MHPIVIFFVSFSFCLFFIGMLRPLAIKLDWVDHPNERKQHLKPVPLIGGLSIFLASSITILLAEISFHAYPSLLLGSLLLMLVGFFDDRYHINPWLRLLVQILCGLMLVFWGGFYLENLGFLTSAVAPIKTNAYLGIILTIIAVAIYINAMNMIDGQDGLLGTVSVVQLSLLAYLSYSYHFMTLYIVLFTLIASFAAFLIFNFPFRVKRQATIFMGDAGSTFIGFVLAWIAIYITQSNQVSHHPPAIVILWVLAFPLFEISTVMIRRLLTGQALFKPDRGHLHYLLSDLGLPAIFLTPLLALFSLCCGLLGVVGYKLGMSESLLFIVFLSSWLIYFSFLIGLYNIIKHQDK